MTLIIYFDFRKVRRQCAPDIAAKIDVIIATDICQAEQLGINHVDWYIYRERQPI